MNMKISNVNVTAMQQLLSPVALKKELPINSAITEHIYSSRILINKIIHGKDNRLLLIVGPCSIHDTESAMEYAERLAAIASEVANEIVVVMRVYFEKPRTSTGWRGMIFDPHLNGSYEIESGLRLARTLLLDLAKRGVVTATEVLDPIVPQYIDDLICWASIGARTAESQTHRELASGLSMAVGFKNSTDGTIDTAINAIVASQKERKFIGIDEAGKTSIITTKGNHNTHLILRGGRGGGNYDRNTVIQATELLRKKHLPSAILIDCSHGNSQKDYRKQKKIFDHVLSYRQEGHTEVVGAMLESNLYSGRQDLHGYSGRLQYGVSVTDSCIGWEETQELIRNAARALAR